MFDAVVTFDTVSRGPVDSSTLMSERETSPPLRSVRSHYDRWSAVYDRDANPLVGLEGPRVREALGDVRGKSALDLGCGTGRHATWLAECGAQVTAVDFSEGMLTEARRKPNAERIRFIVHDLHQRLPFDDGSFDLVVSGLVLEHLDNLDLFFGEARRVLRVGGQAVVSAMHPAMFLRGSQARFTDPVTGQVVQPGSIPHRFGDFVMAAVRGGLALDGLEEYAPDAEFAESYPRAEKYVGWPMLIMMRMRPAAGLSATILP